MKQLLTFILTIFILTTFLISCSTTMLNTDMIGQQYIKSEYYNTIAQFDSVCHADTIPCDIQNWYKSEWLDEETHTLIITYIFVKDLNIPLPITYIYEDSVLEIRKIYNVGQ